MIQKPVRQPTELPHVIQDASNRQVAVCRDEQTAAELVALINGAERGIKPPTWELIDGDYVWKSFLGAYRISGYGNPIEKYGWRFGKGLTVFCDSLSEVQDACWQDYLARLAPIFETPPALAKAKEPA